MKKLCAALLLWFAECVGPCPVAGQPQSALGETQADVPAHESVQWRRTVNGWERAELWHIGRLEVDDPDVTAPNPLPGLHPAVLAGLMFSAAGLLAVPSEMRRRSR